MKVYLELKFFFLLACCFIWIFDINAQNATIDSLSLAFKKETNPEKRIELYAQIARENKELNLNSALLYIDTLESISRSANSIKGQATAIEMRGSVYKDQGQYEKALGIFKQALSLEIKINNPKGISKAYNDIGATFSELYKVDSAVINYLKSIEICEKNNDWSGVASIYGNLGNLYSDQKAHDKAIEYLLKALKIRQEHGEEKKCIYTYNNLAVAYGTKGDIPNAIDCSNKGVALALKYDNKFAAGVILGGMCHLLQKEGKNEEAIPYCEKSIQYLEETKHEKNLVFPLVNLATVYNALKKYDKALSYAKKGYSIMTSAKLIDPLEVYYEEMANAYEGLGNTKEALFWFKKFMVLDDSLFKSENVKNLGEIDTKYQTQKKETEIAKQKLEIAQQQSSLFRQKTWIFGLVGGILLLSILAFLYYNRLKLKQKALLDEAIIKEQKLGLNAVIEAQETERKRIAKDLHDGIAQELVALHLGVSALKHKLSKTSPEEAKVLEELSGQLNDSCIEVRNISHTMMPPTLEQHGLAPSLELLLRNTFQHTNLHFEFDCKDVPANLDEKVKIGVYRIAQELLNNIVKHAQAAQVWVKLFKSENKLVLRIEDNGKGFDFEQARSKASMGLLNILTRVSTLDGVFSFEPSSTQGAVSIIKIPI